MKRFLLLYCAYNQNAYVGHRCESFEADDLPAAKKRAKMFLDQLCSNEDMEFRLIEMAHDSHSRIWAPGRGDDHSGNAYQNRTYFDV
jgi:hypothetical protein